MEERGLVNVDMLTRDINALLVYNMLTYILYMYTCVCDTGGVKVRIDQRIYSHLPPLEISERDDTCECPECWPHDCVKVTCIDATTLHLEIDPRPTRRLSVRRLWSVSPSAVCCVP